MYIRDHKPWVMKLDGSGQRSLGLFGDYPSAYFTSAAMADDGTVVAGLKRHKDCYQESWVNGHYPQSYPCDSGDGIIMLRGGQESYIGNPLPCSRSLGNVDISPDGRLVAFEFSAVSEEHCAPEGAPNHGIAIAEARPGGAALSFVGSCNHPSFIDNNRVIAGCHGPSPPADSGIFMLTAGQNTLEMWVSTQGRPGYPATSREFTHIAWSPDVHSRGELNVWSLGGVPPAQPTGGCTATSARRFTGSSWASDNQTVVFALSDDMPGTAPEAGEGVFAITEPNPAVQCAGAMRLLDPIGDNPDVGATTGEPTAAPPPPPGSPAPGPPSLGPGSGSGGAALRLTATFKARQPLRPALKSGLRASIDCNRTCAVAVELRLPASVARKLKLKPVVGKKSVALPSGTAKKITVRFTSSARAKLARLRSVKLTVKFTAVDSGGKSATKSLPLTLRR